MLSFDDPSDGRLLDRRLTAARPDLAAAALRGKVVLVVDCPAREHVGSRREDRAEIALQQEDIEARRVSTEQHRGGIARLHPDILRAG